MRIGVAVGWPFRYTTCWVELGSSESESNWTFFFLIDHSSEGVEDTDDPTPERELVLFSSSDELGSYPLRRLARRSAAALSSGVLPSSKMSSSSGWLDSLLRGLNELVNWEVLNSTGTEVRVVLINGLSSVLSRRNEWDLVEGAWGILLLCDGTILTKSNIQRQRGCNTSVKCEANSPWKRRYNKAMQVIQSNNTQVKWLLREKSWWPAVEQKSTEVALNETREPLFTNASIRDRPEDSERTLEETGCMLRIRRLPKDGSLQNFRRTNLTTANDPTGN